MKRLTIRKTAGLMALIMMISLLLPIIAYAAAEVIEGTFDPKTGKVKVVLKVTDDTYADEGFANKQQVSVILYSDNVQYGTYYLTYVEGYGNDGYYYVGEFDGDKTNLAGFNGKVYVDVYGFTRPGVVLTTYQLKSVTSGGGGGGGGFPGGIYIPPSTDGVVKANPDGSVDANALKRALESGSATVEISGDVAKLPASALTEGGVVTIVAEHASYELPLDVLDLEALAEELGVSIDDLVIVVTIAVLDGNAKAAAEAAIEAAGGTAVSEVVEFKIEAVAGNESVEVNNFGKFVKRTLKLNGEGDNLVGVRISGDTVNPVPTNAGDEEAAIYSRSNSVYAIIDVAPKSFADLKNHWAEKDINTLAGKLIVQGTGADKFEPKRDVTRAEFAAMIVRALGLQASGEADFSDVASSAWYAEAVAAAAEAGIVKGDGQGKFRPTDKITRQELAAMVVRAQALAGVELDLSNSEVAAVLASFKDAGQIAGWARAELAAAVESGVVTGTSADTVAPTATATRAEAAAMIIRLLNNADFI